MVAEGETFSKTCYEYRESQIVFHLTKKVSGLERMTFLLLFSASEAPQPLYLHP